MSRQSIIGACDLRQAVNDLAVESVEALDNLVLRHNGCTRTRDIRPEFGPHCNCPMGN
jgi:hypothetical protein